MMVTRKYPCVKQFDNSDCGVACLASVFQSYGLRVPLTKLREMAETNKNGTSLKGLNKVAHDFGFITKAVKATRKSCLNDIPLPCIAHVRKDSEYHYIVIYRIKNRITIADPAKCVYKISVDEFNEIWTGVLFFLIPGPNFKKANLTQSPYKRFLYIIKSQSKLFFTAFWISLVYNFLGILCVYYNEILIDEIIPNYTVNNLIILSILVIIVNILAVLLRLFRSIIILHFCKLVDYNLLIEYYDHIIRMPMSFFDLRKSGDILARFNDESKVREAISNAILTLMVDSVSVVIGAIMLYFYNPNLFYTMLIVIILYSIIVTLFNKHFEKSNSEMMESNAKVTSFLIETFNGILTIKSNVAENYFHEMLSEKLNLFLSKIFYVGKITSIQDAIKDSIETIGNIFFLAIGCVCVINNQISLGELITLNALFLFFLTPIKNIINQQPLIESAGVAARRLWEILDLGIEVNCISKKQNTSLKGDIEMNNLFFEYRTNVPVINGVSIHIKHGEKVAFVGESGSGKTTLAKLIMRLYNPNNGSICINSENINDIPLNKLRTKIAYISQQTFLFNATIIENLTLSSKSICMEEIITAAKLAQAHDFISKLPLGYNTKLSENGSNLSGGQRQRLAIARAFLKKPDILILDEATNCLDSIAEKKIHQTIVKSCNETTVISITHRLRSVAAYDKIIVFDKGKVVGSGSHEELLHSNKTYKKLFEQYLE